MKIFGFKLFSGYRVKDSDPVREEDSLLFQKAVDLVEKHKVYLKKDVNLSDVAYDCCSNKSYLSRAIHKAGHRGFKGWVNGKRIDEALELAERNPHITVARLADLCGFGTVATFHKWFKIRTGVTPGKYLNERRRKGR